VLLCKGIVRNDVTAMLNRLTDVYASCDAAHGGRDIACHQAERRDPMNLSKAEMHASGSSK
jgi:hypothetical protein